MEKIRENKRIALLLADIVLINLSYLLAFYLRFAKDIPTRHLIEYKHTFVIITLIYIVVFYFFKLYKSLWVYASIDEFIMAIGGCISGSILVMGFGFLNGHRLPLTVYALAGIFSIILVVGFRISFRIYRKFILDIQSINKAGCSRVMIIGAGQAGNMIVKEIQLHKKSKYDPVVFIDDDKAKIGQTIAGIQIYGGRDKILEASEKYEIEVIIIAIPSMDNKSREEIINICKKTNCRLKIVPSIYDLLNNSSALKKLRDVDVEDLLGRDIVEQDMKGISEYIEDKTVLITGGGGSIGSELARQIAMFKPGHLIILDIYENNAYDLQNELKYLYPELNLSVIIASVRDRQRIDNIFRDYRPQVVFHAAAHKHVPLMEDNPNEAIKNNVFGTLNVAECANKYKAKRFVLISTDKAVNPTNIMGASKRICEMIIQSIDKTSETEFVAVRFGNVLGSNGSVIPLFKKQIANGGPITLTHKEITRFFMTIPEAAQLVLEAGAYASGGEIFVLNMGKPIKIYDLAYDLIRFSGLDPGIDIEIVTTGLRPGEKLFEEVLMDEEGLDKTKNSKIFIAKPLNIEFKALKTELLEIDKLIDKSSTSDIIRKVKKLVPTYKDSPAYLAESEAAATSNLNGNVG